MQKRQSEGYKLLKYLKKTQVDELLCKVKKDNKRNYLIILTLWKTGMRNDELVNLKKKDIKDDEIILRKGKGNKPSMIPLDSSLGDLLSFNCSNLTDDDLLFPLTTASVRNIVHKYQGDGYLKATYVQT